MYVVICLISTQISKAIVILYTSCVLDAGEGLSLFEYNVL